MQFFTWLDCRGKGNLSRLVAALMIGGFFISAEAEAARTLLVDQRGRTPGAYASIAAAVNVVRAGDTISLAPGSGPYRETVLIPVNGTEDAPIVLDGNGEEVTGFDEFQFTRNGSTGRWEYALPPPIAAGVMPFRYLMRYRGQRLLIDYTSKKFTSDFASLSADGSTLILGNAAPNSGWEIGTRKYAIQIKGGPTGAAIPPALHQIYRNLRASGATDDGFNLHGSTTDLRFENIEAFQNFDEGFSAHDAIHCVVDGGRFWGNDNGFYNERRATVSVKANNIQAYDNLGLGIGMQQGVNELTNSQAWDNNVENIMLGGTFVSHSNTTYQNRWARRPFVGYQEFQDRGIGVVPYTYYAWLQGQPGGDTLQPYKLTGEEPVALPVTLLPPFALAYDDWRSIYFSTAEIADPTISGPNADPDRDGLNNLAEYQSGLNPRLADHAATQVSVSVPDAVADSTVAGDSGSIVISRSGSTGNALTVYFQVSGSAVSRTDYAALGSTAVIPAGAESVAITVNPVRRSSAGSTKTVVLTLSPDRGYLVGPGSGTVTIDPSDLPIVGSNAIVSLASYSTGETGRVRISRIGSTARALTVPFVIGGSASSGSDYQPLPAPVTIPAGATFTDIVVTPVRDPSRETDTVVTTLNNNSAYLVASSVSTVTIQGQPAPLVVKPTVSLAVSDGVASETPGNPGAVTISRTGPTTTPLIVYFALSGTATNGVDYQLLGPSVTIPAGAASAIVAVVPRTDRLAEGVETVQFSLSASITYKLGGQTAGAVKIADAAP